MITELNKELLRKIELELFNASIHAKGLALAMNDRNQMSFEGYIHITRDKDEALNYKEESETIFELMILNLSHLQKKLEDIGDIVSDMK